MTKLRICVGSNDGELLAKSHMGDTKFFMVFDVFNNSTYKLVEKRVNIARKFEHADGKKLDAVLNTIKDVDVLVADRKSPNFAKIAQNYNYQPVIIKLNKIDSVLEVIANHFIKISEIQLLRSKGHIEEEIPEFKYESHVKICEESNKQNA